MITFRIDTTNEHHTEWQIPHMDAAQWLDALHGPAPDDVCDYVAQGILTVALSPDGKLLSKSDAICFRPEDYAHFIHWAKNLPCYDEGAVTLTATEF